MDYEALRRIRNEQNSFGNLVGVRIEEIREGYARSVLDVRADLSNPIGSLHGGVLFTIADITGGSAAVSHGEQVTTVYRIDVRDQDGTLLTAGTFTYMSLRKKIEF